MPMSLCVRLYVRHIYPLTHSSPHLQHRSCHYVSVILGWPGDFVNSLYESVMTSRYAYRGCVKQWCSAVTPEAKKRTLFRLPLLVLLHILIIAISDLIQDDRMCVNPIFGEQEN